VLNFIDEECELGLSIGRDKLFGHYKGTWCEASGHRLMSKTAFVEALEDANPTIKCKRPAAEDRAGTRPYVFHGIKQRGTKPASGANVVSLQSGTEAAA
jgi:hypothetical protein